MSPILSGDEFVVISGQHTVQALRRRAEDYQREKYAVPKPFTTVVATILKPQTPLKVRQLAAANEQAAQTMVKSLTVPDFAEVILLCQGTFGKRERLLEAWEKSGWNRLVKKVCSLCLASRMASVMSVVVSVTGDVYQRGCGGD